MGGDQERRPDLVMRNARRRMRGRERGVESKDGVQHSSAVQCKIMSDGTASSVNLSAGKARRRLLAGPGEFCGLIDERR